LPLDSFGDGKDIVEGDGENELEEIEEEAFDLSQYGRKKIAVNYTEIEDT
jgi:hypothetical protein